MHLRRRQFFSHKKCMFGGLVLCAAFYCEWFIYKMQPLFWPELSCCQDEMCTKILFIADPQIQGELAAPSPLNHLFIYDSDQYLKQTFSVVSGHFKPDVLVYLGDIMDEGSVANKQQYQRYVQRIKDIFRRNQFQSSAEVWIPGDNDIGGEMEPIKKDKIVMFEEAFQNTSVITSRNISFYKVNAITNNYQKLEDNNNTDAFKIVISHYPVTMKFNLRTQVAKEIQPDIFFCAHSHEAKYVITSKDFITRNINHMVQENGLYDRTNQCDVNGNDNTGKKVLHIRPDNETYYEVYVPTCSYRMGTSKIGYGAAVYDHKNRTIRYTVFWSPQRFPYLFFYLVVLIIVVMWVVVHAARWLYKRYVLNRFSTARKDSIPLLKRNSLTGDSKLF